jgi:Repeat of unknown function (DUF5650)/Secretion system C-terminal sorting domain
MKKLIILLFITINTFSFAQTTVFTGPTGSSINFGINTTVLDNGNFVVVDPNFSSGGLFNIGAVHLYNGVTYALISSITGSASGDAVGNRGIIKLTNGNFVIWSRSWGGNKGAVTLVNATTGLSGVVSNSNSIVGNTTGDVIGDKNFGNGIFPLPNGNFVVVSTFWQSGGNTNVGAVTWGSGTSNTGVVVGSSNSVVGSNGNDNVGNDGIFPITNGNYVVVSSSWSSSKGAVTWCNGTSATAGIVSNTNSLVGSNNNDQVGIGQGASFPGITVLANSNYVVSSAKWNNNNGAATWCNGTTGKSGVISSTNSLVGSAAGDFARLEIKPLANGHYLVVNSWWNTQTGAVTWCNGTTGLNAVISTTNSFTGPYANQRGGTLVSLLPNNKYIIVTGQANSLCYATWADGSGPITGTPSFTNSLVGDDVGLGGTVVLPNGNYVLLSPNTDVQTMSGTYYNSGAVTFCNGAAGISGFPTGQITTTNSFVSLTHNTNIGMGGITILPNGNYVIKSPNGPTLCNGATGITGDWNTSNSLSTAYSTDFVNNNIIVPLPNSNYILASNNWTNGSALNLGAVTLCNGNIATVGIVDATNSLIGSTENDNLGSGGITVLSNSNAVICSPQWDNGSIVDAGAVTHISGIDVTAGVLSNSNSLVGTNSVEKLGLKGITVLKNGNYVVKNPFWSTSGLTDVGAAAWVNANTGLYGTMNSTNSLIGSKSNDGVNGVIVNALENGNYTVTSLGVDNGTISNAGAVTWGNGSTGIVGTIGINNSLMGGRSDDAVGYGDINGTTPLPNGNYLALSRAWDLALTSDAGAITYGNSTTGVSGLVNNCFSVTGSYSGNGIASNFGYWYNTFHDYLIVGKRIGPGISTISIYNPRGMAVANHLDSLRLKLTDLAPVNFIKVPDCRIIATIKPEGPGASQLYDSVKVKAWVEPTIPYSLGEPNLQRHYEISLYNNLPTIATARVTFYYTQQEFTNFNNDPGSTLNLPTGPNDAAGIANFKFVKYPGISNDYTGLPASYTGAGVVIDPDDNDIKWNPNHNRWEVTFYTTGFSGFFVQTNTGTLPLRFLSFSATKQNENVLLNWKTDNEINVDKFIVERSTNGINFTTVGEKNAMNTNGINMYSLLDDKLTANTATFYYRLKQVDIDGKFVYSQIVKINILKNINISVYPNPTNKYLNINSNAIIKEVIILNSNGQIVKQIKGNLNNKYDIVQLVKGLYILKVVTANETINTKIIKQ